MGQWWHTESWTNYHRKNPVLDDLWWLQDGAVVDQVEKAGRGCCLGEAKVLAWQLDSDHIGRNARTGSWSGSTGHGEQLPVQ